MKTIRASLLALLLAIFALPLRGWIGIDTQRAPVNRWLWLRSEIALAEPRHIDFAFVGSSRILSAARPSVVRALAPGAVAFNFAHFAWGHDADYFVAKTLLERHDVRTLIIEIPPTFPVVVHKQTRHLIGATELGDEFLAAIHELGARDVLGYSADFKERVSRITHFTAVSLFSFPRHVLEFAWARAGDEPWEFESSVGNWEENHGYAFSDAKIEPNPAFRSQQRSDPAPIPSTPAEDLGPELTHPVPGSRSDRYLTRLRNLAARSGTRLVFVIVPTWRTAPPSRALYAYYRSFGEVLIPDLQTLHRVEYYLDSTHLYRAGADAFTAQVVTLLRANPAVWPYAVLYE